MCDRPEGGSKSISKFLLHWGKKLAMGRWVKESCIGIKTDILF